MNSIIDLLIKLTLLVALIFSALKVEYYLNEWFVLKFGKTVAKKIWLLWTIITFTICFLTGHRGIGYFGVAALLTVFILKLVGEKMLAHQYMYCYCMSKNKENINKPEVVRQYEGVMNSIWETASPSLRKKIQKAIEQEEKEYQEYIRKQRIAQCETEKTDSHS